MLYSNRVILKRIRELSNHSSVRILTLKGHLANPQTGKSIDCTNDYGRELYAIVNSLIRDGYLERLEEYKVILTDKGLHPYAQSWENIKHFLFNSVIIPIMISAITTLITLYITG